jgi:hypothetical protein
VASSISILAFALGAAPAFAERPYETQLTGTPTGGGGSEVPFTEPWGLAMDGADNVWVSDVKAGFVDKFDSSNAFVAQGTGEGNWTGAYTRGVAFSDSSEKLFVSDSNADDVWVTKSDGTFESDIKGEESTWGAGCCYIFVAADNSAGITAGDVYVTANGRPVTRIDSTGSAAAFSGVAEYITGNQLTGTPEGAFTETWGAAVDSSGNVYVVDRGKQVVDEFASSGEFIQAFSLTGTPEAVAVDPTNGNVLVATSSGTVDEFSPTGELLGEITGSATPAGSIGEGEVIGVAVNSLGDLYVSDGVNHVVDVFGPSGPPQPKLPLTVEKAGAGVGTVTSSPTGIDCGATCTHEFNEGQAVTLTATPNAKSEFVGWSGGGCSGTGSCEVTLNASTTVTAEFAALPQQVLNVEVNNPAAGSVSSSPEGIECGATCSAEFNENSTVTLIPAPAAGFKFVGWSGCTSEVGENCEVELTAETTVKAEFEERPKFSLNVSETGAGKGTVTSAPSGINCEPEGAGSCSAEFTETSTVVLSATPASGSTFLKWIGCTSEPEGNCEVSITEEATITAEFSQEAPVVTTEAASGVTSTTATITGKVNPKGATTTECRFVYGPTTAYGAEAPCEPSSVSGTTAQTVKATLSSLAPNTPYHYKLIAASGGGESSGSDFAFLTAKSAIELEEEAAVKQHQEEEAAAAKKHQEEVEAAPRIKREQEEAAREAQNKLENEAAAKRTAEIDAVLKRALEEEAAFNKSQERPTLKLGQVKVGARGVTFTLTTGSTGTIKISGPGLKTTTRTVLAGTHRVKVSLTASGRRSRAHRKKIKVTIKIAVGGKTTSLSRVVKL